MPDDRIRAAVSRAVRRPLSIETVHLAPPMADEVEVGVTAVAICHSDIAFLDAHWHADLPAVWGHEAAGIVTAVGGDVAGVAVGDHVVATSIRSCGACRNCSRGMSVACTTPHTRDAVTPLTGSNGEPITHGLRMAAFAEHMVVHETQVTAVPDDLPPASAALLGCGVISGFGAVTNTARIEPGESVVVIGTGGVGLHAVQGARHAGAGVIAAVDVSTTKLEWAGRLGATHVIDPLEEPVIDAVAAATGGTMAHHVIVATGAPAAVEGVFDLIAPGGTLVVVGMPPSGVMLPLDVGTFAGLNQTVLGSKLGTATPAADIPLLVDLYRLGRLELDGLVTGRYPLEGINDAIADARRGTSMRNVVVFDR